MNENKQFGVLDIISLASFGIGAYGLYIGLKNLNENREQTEGTENILQSLKKHLKEQDFHLVSQDQVLENQNKILEKLDRKEQQNDKEIHKNDS